MSVDFYFYIYLIMFFSLFIRGFISGGLVRPLFIYTLVLMLYPSMTLFLYVFDLMSFYPWVTTYNDDVYIKFSQVSLAGTIPFYITSLIGGKGLNKIKSIQISAIQLNGSELYLLKFFLIVYFIFVAININQILFGSYSSFQQGGGYKFFTALDYLIFFALLVRLQVIVKKITCIEKVMLISYFFLKLLTGGRMFMVTIGLALLVHYLMMARPSYQHVRKFTLAIPLVILLMVAAVMAREKSLDLVRGGWSLTQEYLNSCMGALKVSQASISGWEEVNLGMLIDPIISIIPSAIYDRDNFTYFSFIQSKFGGMKGYNPIGGSFLPNEVFLIFPSLWFVFIYFSFMALCLFFVERSLFNKRTLKMTAVGLSIRISLLSMFLVFSIRHYFYVHIKHLFIIVLASLFFWFLAILFAGFSKILSNGHAKLKRATFFVRSVDRR